MPDPFDFALPFGANRQPAMDFGLDIPKPPARKRRRAQSEPFSAEERTDMLGSMMGGLEYLAGALDKPGASARGTISGLAGGEWGGGLANLIPFSDTMGITDRDERVYGRDLNRTLGLTTNQEDTWGNWAAGMGTEIVTDPFLYLRGPMAALTPKGLAAQKAANAMSKIDDILPGVKGAVGKTSGRLMGATPAAVTREIAAGERGLMALKLPFAKNPIATFGAGTGEGMNWAAKAHDWMYYGTGSPMPWGRNVISKTVAGTPGGASQRARDLAIAEMAQIGGSITDATAVLAPQYRQLETNLKGMLKHVRQQGDDTGFEKTEDLMRLLADSRGEAAGSMMALKDMRKMFQGVPDQAMAQQWTKKAHNVINTMRETKNVLAKRVKELGGDMRWLDDAFSEHFPRYKSLNKEAMTAYDDVMRKRLLPTDGKFAFGRKDLLEDAPEGILNINRGVRDSMLVGTRKNYTANEFSAAIRGELDAVGIVPDIKATPLDLKQTLYQNKYITPAMERTNASPAIREWFENGVTVTKEEATEARKAMGEFNNRALDADEMIAFNDATKHLPHHPAHPKELLTESLPSRTRELVEYFDNLPPEMLETGIFDRSIMQDWMDYSDYMTTAIGNLQAGHHVLRQSAKLATGDAAQDAGKVSVREAFMSAKDSRGKPIMSDEGLATFLKEYVGQEGMATKPGMLPYRDNLSKLADDLLVDSKAPEVISAYMEILKPGNQGKIGKLWDDWTKIWKTYLTVPWPAFHNRNQLDGFWRGAARSGSETYSVPGFLKANGEMASWRLGGKGSDDFRRLLAEADDIHLYGPDKGRLAELAIQSAKPKGSAWNPLTHVKTAHEKVGEVGGNIYEWVEMNNRLPPYIAARRAGRTPSQAKALVDNMQFDYSKGVRGSFEWKMKRIVPFWGFVSNNIPYQLGQLGNRPGGGHAQTLRAISSGWRTKKGEEPLPGWLRERIGFRNVLNPGTEEAANIVRQFGLSIEDLADFTFEGGIPSTRTLARYASRAHPGITTPLKMFSGKDLFTGREASQMYSPTGNKTLDTIIYSSPGARALSTEEMLRHPGKNMGTKALDFLTGVKVGTYDLPKQRAYELQGYIERKAKADPNIWSDEFFFTPKHLKEASKGTRTEVTLENLNRMKQDMKRMRAAR